MSVNAPDFEYLRGLLREEAAIVLDPGKEYLVETRLEPLAISEGFATVGSMVSALRLGSAQGLQTKVVERMTTNETSFFRDVYLFDALKRSVVPELIARRAQERALYIWCGACSSGQEPYSIMMLLRDAFPALADWNISILATDINAAMLQRAREGIYSQLEVNRGLPATMLLKFFEKKTDQWRIVDHVRRGIEFRALNLVRSWSGIPRLDLIFLRNVMIYFSHEAKCTILSRVRQHLRPDGYLFLGGAETTYGVDEAYERVVRGKVAAYRIKPGYTASR